LRSLVIARPVPGHRRRPAAPAGPPPRLCENSRCSAERSRNFCA